MSVWSEAVGAFFDGVNSRRLTTFYSRSRIYGQLKFTDHLADLVGRDQIPQLATAELTYESGRQNPGIVYLRQTVHLKPTALWVADFLDPEDVKDRNPPANQLSPVSDRYNIKDTIRIGLMNKLKRGRRLVLAEEPSLKGHIDDIAVELSFKHPDPVNFLEFYAYMDGNGNCLYPISAYAVPINDPEKEWQLEGIRLLQKPPLNVAEPPFKAVMDCFLDLASGKHAADLKQAIAVAKQYLPEPAHR